jgi:hypothetical protein
VEVGMLNDQERHPALHQKNVNNLNSKSKPIQTLTHPKRTFPSSKKLTQNMVVKVLKRGTTFSIVTSPDLKLISNKN